MPDMLSRETFRYRDAFHEFRLAIALGVEPEETVKAYLRSQGVNLAGLEMRIKEMLGVATTH